MPDIVDDVLQRLRALAPDIPAQITQQLEAQTRQAWGGTEPYVAKRPALQRSLALGDALRSGKPLGQAFDEAGVKRRFGYSLLSRRLR